ncbi:MAG: DUF6809 family protein [Blautia sp.]
MKNVLLRLYEGEISPAEQLSPKMREYREIRQRHYRHYEDFIEELRALDPPLDMIFIQIMDEQLETVPCDFSQSFVEGFRLGARMMIEVYQEERQE